MKNLVLITLTTFVLSNPAHALVAESDEALKQKQEAYESTDQGRSTSSVRNQDVSGQYRNTENNPNFRNSRQTPIKEGELIDNTGHDTNTRFIP